MPLGLPGADVKFLANVAGRLSERRLHAYHPGARRSAAALVLRFDEPTQRTLTTALAAFRALTRQQRDADVMVAGKDVRLDAQAFLRYLQEHCVDPAAPSSLQLLFLKRADMDASRWSGQVAFPGGRRDPEDADDFQTVCRETYEELGLPLQHHREFVCLGRLPDHRLHSRAVNSSGLVQARFVFLHVGDMTPTVQIASHVVESVRWMPLRRLTAAHVEHGCVAHPLQTFVHAQDADYRLLLTELFPGSYLSFPSVSIPRVEGDAADTTSTRGPSTSTSSSLRTWRVWGLTLRSANELLALDNRQPFDWPLVESNSRVLRYGLLFPFHGYYEVLYQFYCRRAWCAAWLRQWRPGGTSGGQAERDRRVLHGSAMERRYAALPVSADALLFAAPEQPVPAHVLSFLCVVAVVVFVLYTIATVISTVFAAVGLAVGVEAALEREERKAAYYAANVPQSRSAQGKREDDGDEDNGVTATTSGGAGQPVATVTSPSPDQSAEQREGGRPVVLGGHRSANDAALTAALGGGEVHQEATAVDASAASHSVKAPTVGAKTETVASPSRDGGDSRLGSMSPPSTLAGSTDRAVPVSASPFRMNGASLRHDVEQPVELTVPQSALHREAGSAGVDAQAASHSATAAVLEDSYHEEDGEELQAVLKRYRGT